MRRTLLPLLAVALGLLTVPAAHAQELGLTEPGEPVPGAPVEPAEAVQVLGEAEAAIDGEAAAPDPTLALHALGQVLPALDGAQRERGERLMARPTDRRRDPEGNGYTRPAFFIASTHFCVHFVKSGSDAIPLADTDADGTPDFAQAIANLAETSYEREHGALGWRRPMRDSRGCQTVPDGGKGRTDIYAIDLPNGVYGYATTDAASGSRRPAYLVVDNDMAEIQGFTDPRLPLAVTLAHEYNHVIQFAYDYWQQDWMLESTATAVEEQVFPNVNDYLQYLPAVARRVAAPLTRFGHDLKPYGSAVWNFFLMKRYGTGIVPRSWAVSQKTRPESFGPAAFDRAIRAASDGRSGFVREFVLFATTLAEWRGSATYPDSAVYPRVTRSATLRHGLQRRLKLDHTTYRLFRVPTAGRRAATLRMRAPRGVATGLALVGQLPGGRLVRVVKVLPRGGAAAVRVLRPARFRRLTAVIVNADYGQRGFNHHLFDWDYSGDNAPYRVGLTR